jgi:hypothetical protein
MKEQREGVHDFREAAAEGLAHATLDQLWQLFHAPFIVRRAVDGRLIEQRDAGGHAWPASYQTLLQKKCANIARLDGTRIDERVSALYHHLGTKNSKVQWYDFFAQDELHKWLISSERLDTLLSRDLNVADKMKEEIVATVYTTKEKKWDVCLLLYRNAIETEGKRLDLCIESLKMGSAGAPYLELTRPRNGEHGRRRILILSLRPALTRDSSGRVGGNESSVLTFSYDPDTRMIVEAEGGLIIEHGLSGPKQKRTFLRRTDPWFPAFLEFVNHTRESEEMPVQFVLSESPIPGPGMVLLDTGEEVPIERVFPLREKETASAGVIAGGYMTPEMNGTHYGPEEYALIARHVPMTLSLSPSVPFPDDALDPYRSALTEVRGSLVDYGESPTYSNLTFVGGMITRLVPK